MKFVLRFGIVGQGRVRGIGRKFDGRAVAPAADELGGEFLLAAGVVAAQFVEVGAEGGDVLVQLAVDHEAAVVGEQVRHGRDREFAGFVGVAEEEFAGGKRYPVAIFGQFALTGLTVALGAFEIGIAEAVGITEVLLVCRTCYR